MVGIIDYPYKVGTKLFVRNAGEGAWGCNKRKVEVISSNGIIAWSGMESEDVGFFVRTCDSSEAIWKICPPGYKGAEYIILDAYSVELI